MSGTVPGRIGSILNIHNPSVEIHPVDRGLNTSAAVILAEGGGHNTLNVGSEAADFVPFFFLGIIYPNPSPFTRSRPAPPIPANVPAAFIACAGSDDAGHAVRADEYFAAMLAKRVPNIEMRIYGTGRHPGDALPDGSHMTGGLTDRNFTPYGSWQFRFIDWFRDPGFLEKPCVETKTAKDVATYVSNPPRTGGEAVRVAGAPCPKL